MGIYSYIKGELVKRTEDYIVIDNNGIGYEINCPFSISSKMDAIGSQVTVWLYQSVREDDISLYGFAAPEQKDMFLLLITVSGIGPKVAHGICAQMEPDRLALAVMNGDVKALTSVKGLGKKGAERVILELKDKLKGVEINTENISSAVAVAPAPVSGVTDDAVEALIVLGYKQSDAYEAVSRAYTEGIGLQELIRNSLRMLAR